MREVVIGLDPGGAGPRQDGKFGWAIVQANLLVPRVISTGTARDVEGVVRRVIQVVLQYKARVVGVGVDGFLSTDHRNWRNVDL